MEVEIDRLPNVFHKAGIVDVNAVDGSLAVIDGLKPQNEAEAMLAAQIAATHDRVVGKARARAWAAVIRSRNRIFVSLTLSRLHRAFTTQLEETLSNMRRGGRQKVVVEITSMPTSIPAHRQ